MKALRWIVAALAAVLFAGGALALDVPPLTGRAVDNAKVLTYEQKREIEGLLAEIEHKGGGAQVVVLTIESLEGDTPEDFAQRVFDKWKPGQKGKDNGILIVIAKKERKLRIHTGYGVEGFFPDGSAGTTIRQIMAPHLNGKGKDKKKAAVDDYHGAIKAAVEHIGKLIAGEIAPQKPKPKTPGGSKEPEGILLLFLIPLILAIIAHIMHPVAGGVVGGAGCGLMAAFVIGGVGAIAIAALIGFVLGLIGYIPGIGAIGGGDGGFSGGGGMSGGGGATGDF